MPDQMGDVAAARSRRGSPIELVLFGGEDHRLKSASVVQNRLEAGWGDGMFAGSVRFNQCVFAPLKKTLVSVADCACYAHPSWYLKCSTARHHMS